MGIRTQLLRFYTNSCGTYARLVHSASRLTSQPEQSEQTHTGHIYHQLVPWKTGKNLARHLYENALFENENFIALDKPNRLARYSYQMPLQLSRDQLVHSHGGVCLNDALPHLQKMINTDFLDVTLGVHRDASGVVVLSKSERYHKLLRQFFKIRVRMEKQFLQSFWAITHGIPVPEKLETRIGLKKEKIGDYVMTVVKPVSANEAQRQRGQRPYIQYRTLVTSDEWNCALVEVKPTSTRWDCIEVHLASKLAPLLGDHVYSGRVGTVMGKRIAVKQSKCPPVVQDLPRQLLYRLNLERKDAYQVPQHLHLHSLWIPKLVRGDKRDREIIAPLPDYFRQTMNWLDLPVPVR